MIIVLSDKLSIESSNDVYYLKSICDIKSIKDEDNILVILDVDIKEGVVGNIILDEIFISLNLRYIIVNNQNINIKNMFKNLSSFYKVPLIIM